MQRLLITLGVIALALGIVWPWLAKLGLGRLPGDIVYERGGTRLYIPLMTCLIISVFLSVIAWWWRR